MTESYPDKVLKDIDGRQHTKAPWQKSTSVKKKPFRRRPHPAKMAEDDDDDYEDDANALDDDDDYDGTWDEEEGEEEKMLKDMMMTIKSPTLTRNDGFTLMRKPSMPSTNNYAKVTVSSLQS